MKKYIAIFAILTLTGCGSAVDDITTTEATTETTTEITSEYETYESFTLNNEDETAEAEIVAEPNKEIATAKVSENFSDSKKYEDVKKLAESAGFETSFSNNTITAKTYITDDTIDYIKEKDEYYADRWNELCGKYEELSGEIIGMINDNSINLVLEVVGRSDNVTYFKNENGKSIYDSYNS